jgi:hypothetical protein
VDQIVQGARACAHELVGKKMAQVEARDSLIHCPRVLGGAPVAPGPPVAVGTAASELECAVMGTHRAPGYCFLEGKMVLIGAVV